MIEGRSTATADMMNNDRARILGKIKAAGVPVMLSTGDAELGVKHEYIEQPGITHGPVITSSQKEIYDFFARHVKQ